MVWGRKYWIAVLPALLLVLDAGQIHIIIHYSSILSLAAYSNVGLVHMVSQSSETREQCSNIHRFCTIEIFLRRHARCKSPLHG